MTLSSSLLLLHRKQLLPATITSASKAMPWIINRRCIASMAASFSVDDLIGKAKIAEKEFSEINQQEIVDRIFLNIAHEADRNRVPLAVAAYEETKMGLLEDKVLKNGLAAELIRDRYKDTKTVGIIDDDPLKRGIKRIAEPVGTVVCITPTTNPTSTAIAKSLFLAKTRNTGIFLPHPKAAESTAKAVQICHDAGVAAGAPPNFIQCVTDPTMDISNSIMNHPDINLILATGGPSMVKAAYSTGHPAIGVGSGNAPILVDETADLLQACGSIILGKTFDNGMICAAEQSIVVVDEVYDELKTLLHNRGVEFLEGENKARLEKFMFDPNTGRVNPDVVGQSAQSIANKIGIMVPKETVVLAAEETRIGPDIPMSHEKLSPILAMYRAKDFEEGVELCKQLTSNGGMGHTAGIYSKDGNRLDRYANEIPAGRIIANAPTSITAVGTEFNHSLDPSFTLGVGTHAGSSTSDNIGPMHLLNIKTLADRQEHMEWYNNPPVIYFNRGCLEQGLAKCAMPLPDGHTMKRCMIVTDKVMGHKGYVDRVKSILQENHGFVVDVFDDVHPDPDMETIRNGVDACERFDPDLMVCLGGGSPMDAGKFIRAKYENPELSLEDAATRFLELQKRTSPFPVLGSKIRKLVCIPTTSGTASEVTPFSVITDDLGRKYPVFSYRLTPDIAIIDSNFCDGIPQSLIAFAGIDAITHAIEAYVSVASNEFTESHSMTALKLLVGNLVESYRTGSKDSREAVHHGATLAGLAFSNSFLGITHSLAHQVGSNFHLPHGLTCGILLPHVMRYNSSKQPTRMGAYPGYDYPMALERYAQIARNLGINPTDGGNTDEELLEELIHCFEEMYSAMDFPMTFQEAAIPEQDFLDKLDEMALAAFDDQCTPSNPRFPLVAELANLLKQAYYGVEDNVTNHHGDNDHKDIETRRSP